MRLKIVNIAIISMFLLLGAGLLNTSIIKGARFKELSDKNCIRLLPQGGSRGKILDRSGAVIVDSKISYDVMILSQDQKQIDTILAQISDILGVPFNVLKNTYKNNYIAASVPATVAQGIDMKKAIALEEIKIDYPGIIIQGRPLRHYPYREVACHIIGYVNEIDRWRLTKLVDYGYKTKDIVGFGGVEEKYDYFLREKEGGLSVQVDHRGKFVRVLGFQPPHNGKDVQLTLDLKIQRIVEDKLAGREGCVVIMEPSTGEIIAMASAPNFDPSVFSERKGASISRVINNSQAPLINRAISGLYPAGSTFKVIVAAAALETGKINSNTTFVCQGSTLIGRKEFSCWSTHHEQSLIPAIAHSCNIFFYKTGLIAGAQAIHDYAIKFGLSKPMNFELPYEATGFVPSPLWRKVYKFKNWFDGDTANLAIGQGDLLVTPLQMTRVMAVFANNGYLVTPYIVKGIDGQDISSHQRKNAPINLKPSTIEFIRKGLRQAVTDSGGTANVLSDLSVAVAAKTGTAQAPPGQPHAWFVGFLPYQNPKFVMCVFLEHGGPGYYSSVLAKEIISEMIKEGLI